MVDENKENNKQEYVEEGSETESNLLPSNHGERWSEREIIDLLDGVINGLSWDDLAKTIHRKPSSIRSKFANLIVERINNADLAQVLLSASGSPPPNRNPKNSISGVNGERPSPDSCPVCSSLLGPRCNACGNTIIPVNISQNDFSSNGD